MKKKNTPKWFQEENNFKKNQLSNDKEGFICHASTEIPMPEDAVTKEV